MVANQLSVLKINNNWDDLLWNDIFHFILSKKSLQYLSIYLSLWNDITPDVTSYDFTGYEMCNVETLNLGLLNISASGDQVISHFLRLIKPTKACIIPQSVGKNMCEVIQSYNVYLIIKVSRMFNRIEMSKELQQLYETVMEIDLSDLAIVLMKEETINLFKHWPNATTLRFPVRTNFSPLITSDKLTRALDDLEFLHTIYIERDFPIQLLNDKHRRFCKYEN